MATRFKKSKTDKIIDGVCGGIAEHFEVDPVIVRLAFVLFTFINGFGIILYIILAIIMPGADKADMTPKETIDENIKEIGENLKRAGEEIEKKIDAIDEKNKPSNAKWLGAILILLGLFLLIDKLNLLWWLKSDILLSALLILLGVWLLISRSRSRK